MVESKIKQNKENKEIQDVLYDSLDLKVKQLQENIKKENQIKKELGLSGD